MKNVNGSSEDISRGRSVSHALSIVKDPVVLGGYSHWIWITRSLWHVVPDDASCTHVGAKFNFAIHIIPYIWTMGKAIGKVSLSK
jgi:hypothetical protein